MKKSNHPQKQMDLVGNINNKKKRLGSQTKLRDSIKEDALSVAAREILPDEEVQFVLMSFRLDQDNLCDDTYRTACEMLCGETHKHRILLQPGVAENQTFTWFWPVGTEVITKQAREYGFSALFETQLSDGIHYHVYDRHGGIQPDSYPQVFAGSQEANAKKNQHLVQDLFSACQKDGSRILTVGGVKLGLLICGENNILYNKQSDGNRVSVRHHPGSDIFDDVRVVLNGSHTVMGNWGKLERRFEYLSRDKRFMFYTTNNTKSWWTTSLRVYYDGQRLADGKGVWKDDLYPIKMVKDPQDRFRALVVDVPYRDLS